MDGIDGGGMSFWDHTKELLQRLRTVVYSIVVLTIFVMLMPVTLDFSNIGVGSPFYPTIASSTIRHLQDKFLPAEAELLPLNPISPLEIYVFVSLILAIIASMPVISYEVYKFLNPALHAHERKDIMKFTAAFSGLFVFGVALGYSLILPLTVQMMILFSNLLSLAPTYAFDEFISLMGLSLLICGLVFTLPVFLILFVKARLLETKSLTKNRKFLYGFLIIAIAILDPDPGLVTEAVVFIPLVIITEISIVFAKRIERNRRE